MNYEKLNKRLDTLNTKYQESPTKENLQKIQNILNILK